VFPKSSDQSGFPANQVRSAVLMIQFCKGFESEITLSLKKSCMADQSNTIQITAGVTATIENSTVEWTD
jgi:phosphotransferase system HPr-like phosphotransfer protein